MKTHITAPAEVACGQQSLDEKSRVPSCDSVALSGQTPRRYAGEGWCSASGPPASAEGRLGCVSCNSLLRPCVKPLISTVKKAMPFSSIEKELLLPL